MPDFQAKYIGFVELSSSIVQYKNEFRNKLISEAIYRVTHQSLFHIFDENFPELREVTEIGQMNSIILRISKDSFQINSQYYTSISVAHSTKKISYVHLVDERKPSYMCYVARDDDGTRAVHILEMMIDDDLRRAIQMATTDTYGSLGKARIKPSPCPSYPPSQSYATPPPNLTSHRQENFGNSFENQRSQLLNEEWYHGPISKREAMDLVEEDGSFLVRESKRQKNQFVLTMNNRGTILHINLLQGDGQVKFISRGINNVRDLIEYHYLNQVMITLDVDKILLKTPVRREY